MGIDARILVRGVRRDVTDEEILAWSVRLTRAIGPQHFWLNRKEGRHAISRATWWDEAHDEEHHDGLRYSQDGESVRARPNECLLEVHAATRFYGPGYERGDILTLCAIAEALEQIIPAKALGDGATMDFFDTHANNFTDLRPCVSVWYGGDSSGVEAEPFSESERKRLRKHLYSEAGRAYYNHKRPSTLASIPVPICDLCRVPMSQFGFGRSHGSFHCQSCDYRVLTSDSGETWHEFREDGFNRVLGASVTPRLVGPPPEDP